MTIGSVHARLRALINGMASDSTPPPKQNTLATGVGLGLVMGVAIGAALDNVGLGIAIGLSLGTALGITMSRQSAPDKEPDDTGNRDDEPHEE